MSEIDNIPHPWPVVEIGKPLLHIRSLNGCYLPTNPSSGVLYSILFASYSSMSRENSQIDGLVQDCTQYHHCYRNGYTKSK